MTSPFHVLHTHLTASRDTWGLLLLALRSFMDVLPTALPFLDPLLGLYLSARVSSAASNACKGQEARRGKSGQKAGRCQ
jgi:hypothetical protein